MEIKCVWEHNGEDSILYAADFVGAFTRGASKEEAISKMPAEVRRFQLWQNLTPSDGYDIVIVQEKESELEVKDADSDVLFESEEKPLTAEEYQYLKTLAMKSAEDFYKLYNSFPDKNKSSLPPRKTFYGDVPRTAEEMYQHTKNVNDYYFSEIGVDADNEGNIVSCRARGFEALEATPNYLTSGAIVGSYDEMWSLRKVLRRFIWHDRIHAKAMYRMGVQIFGKDVISDVFGFGR